MIKKFSSLVVLFVAMAVNHGATASTWFSEEYRLDELYNDIKSSAPNLGTQTDFVYMGYTDGSGDNDWICFTAGSSGTLKISQYSQSNTEVYYNVSYLTDPIATPYASGTMSVTKGTKYYFCINNYKLWQTGEYYYWSFTIGGTPVNTRTITFQAGGGSGTMSQKSVTSGSIYTLPSCGFSRSGYTFAGWNITSSSTTWNNPYSAGSKVTVNENLTLTATWKSSSPSYPDLKPYKQSGWDSSLVVNSSSTSKSNASSFKDTDTIYVHFSAICENKATSTSFVSKIYVDGTSKFTVTSGQTDAGTIFYTASGCSVGKLSAGSHTIKVVLDDGKAVTESNESNNTMTKTITVTATQKYYAIRFNKNDGSGATKVRTSYPIGKSKNLAWLNSDLGWTYQNVTFKGWSTSSTATYATYKNGESVYNLTTTANATVNLYAVLAANVSFKAGGGSGSKATVEVRAGSSYTLPSCPFTRSGYTFKGWNVTPQNTNAENPMSVGRSITVSEHTVLTAVWTPKAYTVRFHYNEPDKDDGRRHADKTYSQKMTVGVSQNLAWKDSQIGWKDPTGYRFEGWVLTSAAKSTLLANGQTVYNLANADEVIDLYAVWKLLPQTYLVRFHDNMPNPQKKTGHIPQTYDQSFTIDRAQRLAWKDSQIGFGWETPSGYVFLGWSKSSTATVASYKNGEKVKNLGADGEIVKLYAVWGGTTPTTYKVVFHRNYTTSDATVYDQTFTSGVAQSLAWKDSKIGWSNPSGKTFLGWARTSTATSAAFTNGQSVKDIAAAGATLDLFAVWKSSAPVPQTYTVRFNKNDGSGATATQVFTCGVSQCLKWKDSQLKWTYAGHVFVGWTDDSSAFYENGASVKDIGSAGQTVNLHAIWIETSKAAPAYAKSASESVSREAMGAFTPGYYCGVFADGSGTFDLLLDEFDEDGTATAYFAAQAADGDLAEECEAAYADNELVLKFSAQTIVVRRENAGCVAEVK